MSILKQKLRTSRWLWATASVALFVWMGFVFVLPISKSFETFWGHLGAGVRGEAPLPDTVMALCLYGVLLSIPAFAIGWVVQAVVVAGLAAVSESNSRKRINLN